MTTNKTKNFNVFKIENWYTLPSDEKKAMFKGFTKKEFTKAQERAIKHLDRAYEDKFVKGIYEKRRELIEFFKNVPYIYEGEGNEDCLYVQKPTEKGYIAICYGEQGNNVYIEDKLLVRYLTAKYNKRFNN